MRRHSLDDETMLLVYCLIAIERYAKFPDMASYYTTKNVVLNMLEDRLLGVRHSNKQVIIDMLDKYLTRDIKEAA